MVECEKNELQRLRQELAKANHETENLKANAVKQAEQSQSKHEIKQSKMKHEAEQLQVTVPQASQAERQQQFLLLILACCSNLSRVAFVTDTAGNDLQ